MERKRKQGMTLEKETYNNPVLREQRKDKKLE